MHKAIILARGLGTRMRKQAHDDTHLSAQQKEAAQAGTKGLINVGRPFLDYVISALADIGVSDVCLVIGPEHHAFRDYYDSIAPQRVTMHYAVQEKPLGTANAVSAAQEFMGNDRAIILNSDNYYPVESLRALAQVPGSGVVGFSREAMTTRSNIAPERIKSFAIIDVEGEGEEAHLADIIEKPSDEALQSHPDAPLSMNCWLFTPAIMEICANVAPSARGELEIVDAVRALAAEEEIRVVFSDEGVLDMSNQDDIPSVARALEGVEVSL